jgi:transcriptional regulator with XRE-family HTH domain
MMPSLKELRTASGKSRAEVARDFEMSERHLLRLEHGETKLRRIHALAFARYYGVPMDDIDEWRAA